MWINLYMQYNKCFVNRLAYVKYTGSFFSDVPAYVSHKRVAVSKSFSIHYNSEDSCLRLTSAQAVIHFSISRTHHGST